MEVFALVNGTVGNFIKLYRGGFAAITRNSFHQYPSLGRTGILPGYFNIIIRNFGIDKITGKLFGV